MLVMVELQEEPPLTPVQEHHLGSGERQAGSNIFSVDAAQEGRRVVQAWLFLPQQKLCVQNRVHLQGEDAINQHICSESFITLVFWMGR